MATGKKKASKKVAKTARKITKPGAAKLAGTELEIRAFRDAAAFRTWLARNHASSPGIWIKLAKKGSGLESITYPKAIDDTHWLTKFTPRRARSIWSKINRDKATALIERGDMEAPGQAEITRAKADGRWDAAYDSPRTSTVPADFAKALATKPRAVAFFEQLNGANRYAILWRLQTAKRPETRAKRIAQFVAMLARGEKIHA
jgi:uncharacterized protein YdeI (YjbR/CyaY-like superfamily)